MVLETLLGRGLQPEPTDQHEISRSCRTLLPIVTLKSARTPVVRAGDVVFTHRSTLGQVALVPNGLRCRLRLPEAKAMLADAA